MMKTINLNNYNQQQSQEINSSQNISCKNENEEIEKRMKKEYKEVCLKTPFETHKMQYEEKQKMFPTSCKHENWSKNRYNDILCNEETRFLFKSNNCFKDSIDCISFDSIFNSSEETVEEEKYINANNIEGFYKCNNHYIATQAPLENTFQEFYEMIWQSKTNVVIALTSLVENGRVKMNQYWPEKKKTFGVSQFEVSLVGEVKTGSDLVIRKLKVKNLCENEERTIFQIHYTGWPDNGVPNDYQSFVQIYNYQKLFAQEGKKSGLNGSPIVHCSAGIGRTATYIAFAFIAQLIDFVKTQSSSVTPFHIDVPSIVNHIRKQRSGSVQNWEQYAFIYSSVQFYKF